MLSTCCLHGRFTNDLTILTLEAFSSPSRIPQQPTITATLSSYPQHHTFPSVSIHIKQVLDGGYPVASHGEEPDRNDDEEVEGEPEEKRRPDESDNGDQGEDQDDDQDDTRDDDKQASDDGKKGDAGTSSKSK
ncbi:unnamed protein product [Phytophthora fragariaefolia]|uniref:Unnamed protein product n=1 Tax=Phytophthora fragariaefolia TaxID=1490495 RepID=A0A9W7D2D1_9STRA|nr:unnamed protein product [Phytophthora fragariaefolia]